MIAEAVREEVITRNPAALVRPPTVTRQEVTLLGVRLRQVGSSRRRRTTACMGGSQWGCDRSEAWGAAGAAVDGCRPGPGPRPCSPERSAASGRGNRVRNSEDGAVPAYRPVAGAIGEGAAFAPGPTGGRGVSSGPGWSASGLLFTSTVGTVIEPRNLSRLFDNPMAAAKVRRIRFSRPAPHLRFTAAGSRCAGSAPEGFEPPNLLIRRRPSGVHRRHPTPIQAA